MNSSIINEWNSMSQSFKLNFCHIRGADSFSDICLVLRYITILIFLVQDQARRLGGSGGSDNPPLPTAWKGPLGGLLTNNLTGLNLTGLSLTGLNIHYTTPVDTVVDCYARLHPRRLQLENLLQ